MYHKKENNMLPSRRGVFLFLLYPLHDYYVLDLLPIITYGESGVQLLSVMMLLQPTVLLLLHRRCRRRCPPVPKCSYY